MRKYALFFTLLLSALVFLSGCDVLVSELSSALMEDTTQTVNIELMETGRAVYLSQYCGICHQLDYAETRGNFGPPHNAVAVNAAEHIQSPNYNGEATTVEEYLYESILQPQIYYTPGYETTNHHMPSYAHLPQEDIDAMVYMLLQQDGS